MDDEAHTNPPDDLVASSSTDRASLYRPLSSKRPRDPSQRKNVSFNDVPIVHEVPSHDTMRNSNSETYRSWTYTDATPPVSIVSPFASSQILSPFHSTNAATQKLHAHRLSSALYSSTNSTTLTRLPDWIMRTKPIKPIDELLEYRTSSNQPLVIVNTHDERTTKQSSTNQQVTSDNGEEKKYSYRTAVVPDTEHYRSLPFAYVPLSESTSTYTTILSTNFNSSSNHSSHGQTRNARARSATLPINIIHSATHNHDNISITPIRTTATATLSNSSLTPSSSRTVLKPATIAFQYSQPTVANTSTLIITNTKSPQVTPRLNTSFVHSRVGSSTINRPLSSNKHSFSHPSPDSMQKSPPTAFTRSRSANVFVKRPNTTSPVTTIETQSGETNIYATTKRNPNIRQAYGSHYMHRILLPTNIN
ncbi:unnamed protein product [Rotaria magnacalcarata]|uniref:Uncharacterized protein n=4 Tax=Rotaria magnacalcarata TaxID=392030 RepID=A0A817A5V9_9BILA|nr:unnamed protein product [Rotaria magnacalcarata]CAF1643237.1 unnamed protein product [Rotaria magnacalcarata]CAF2140389.1 unnamed protein product [Rotaria magnacalcarata]CAF2143661.1 unnamed protein product [Rotaria magnacalcarata]CAF2244409.1 unnamed protein product [Rotaria magnacalcarata]